jgi:hypothetical protein
MEEQILQYQCYLTIQALEIKKQAGDLKLLKEIMDIIGTHTKNQKNSYW